MGGNVLILVQNDQKMGNWKYDFMINFLKQVEFKFKVKLK